MCRFKKKKKKIYARLLAVFLFPAHALQDLKRNIQPAHKSADPQHQQGSKTHLASLSNLKHGHIQICAELKYNIQ